MAPPDLVLRPEEGSGRDDVVLRPGRTTIGRAEAGSGQHLQLSSDSVSRRHAQVELRDQTLTIEDLGSRNGTWVGGRRVEPGRPVQVHVGDILVLGTERWSVQRSAEEQDDPVPDPGRIRDRRTRAMPDDEVTSGRGRTEDAGTRGREVPSGSASRAHALAPWVQLSATQAHGGTDRVSEDPDVRSSLLRQRVLSVTHLTRALHDLELRLPSGLGRDAPRTWPSHLTGVLQQPNGEGCARVQVELCTVEGRPVTGAPWTVSANDGSFSLTLPTSRDATVSDTLVLRVSGSNGRTNVTLDLDDVSGNGVVGVVTLPIRVEPQSSSILGQLAALLPATSRPHDAAVDPSPGESVSVRLGESDVDSRTYRHDSTVERFPYSMLVRLVMPRPSMNPVVSAPRESDGTGTLFLPLLLDGWNTSSETASPKVVERVPLELPVDVTYVKTGLAGIGANRRGTGRSGVALAGTLGLGYVVRMSQHWTPQGLALGNLVYSLPLAPGEQQRVAVEERREVQSVSETEAVSSSEDRTFSETDDTSVSATVRSAFTDSATGSSTFDAHEDSESRGKSRGAGLTGGVIGLGASILGVSAGAGSTSASSSGHQQGSSTTSASSSRDSLNDLAQATHTNVARQASARRQAFRTGVRLASDSEQSRVTTKTIANHNKTRALTVQYWEVIRLFEVQDTCDGVTLVCFVPLDPVRFLPAREPLALSSDNPTRAELLHRYQHVLDHVDVLAQAVPTRYRRGLQRLADFAADPRVSVGTATGGSAEDVVAVSMQGSFVPNEEVFVSVRTRSGSVIGPVPMTGKPLGLPSATDPAPEARLTSEEDLLDLLRRRRTGSSVTFSATIALPSSTPSSEVVGFEVSRRFSPIRYHYPPKVVEHLGMLKAAGVVLSAGTAEDKTAQAIIASFLAQGAATTGTDVTTSAERLEAEVGAAQVTSFSAQVLSTGQATPEPLAQGYAFELGVGPRQVPAQRLSPSLSFSSVLEIERVLQHLIRNTTAYSKVIWRSLTPEERVIMLQSYTIGPPDDPADDASGGIPLLSCVSNTVLGFDGNCMILPFAIPVSVAQETSLTTGQVQDLLTQYHVDGFSPPRSTVSLPTRGVLGEAVLGSSPSAERIDLTRFWNWQDSPSDPAPEIAPVSLAAEPVLSGVTAPSTLAGMPSLINNITASGAQPDLAALSSTRQSASQLAADPTASGQLAGLLGTGAGLAESARKDALDESTAVAGKAIDASTVFINAVRDVSVAAIKEGGGPAGAGAAVGSKGAARVGSAAGNSAASNNGKAASAPPPPRPPA